MPLIEIFPRLGNASRAATDDATGGRSAALGRWISIRCKKPSDFGVIAEVEEIGCESVVLGYSKNQVGLTMKGSQFWRLQDPGIEMFELRNDVASVSLHSERRRTKLVVDDLASEDVERARVS
jgi:hypothetical protein